MNERDLEKLSKAELIKMVEKLQKKARKPKIVIVDDDYRQVPPPRTYKPIPPLGSNETIKKTVPKPCKSAQKMVNKYENLILPPPTQFRHGYKRRLPLPPQQPKPSTDWLSNFDDEILQTGNGSLRKFEILSTSSFQNKKSKSYINEFKVKIFKKLEDVKEIYRIFQELINTVKRRRKLSDDDRLRFVIQNKELPNVLSAKFNKVKDFSLGDLENVIRILEYRDIPLENCRIVVQSVKIPNGKRRLYLTKNTVSRKNCVITVKNDDTICLAKSILTAYANLKPEKWTKTQLQDGFNRSRKLQRGQAMKLHEDANVEINDYGNDLSDVESFAEHLGIEINIIDAEPFNSIVYTANKGSKDKIYLLKTRNHFDVIKSLTAF